MSAMAALLAKGPLYPAARPRPVAPILPAIGTLVDRPGSIHPGPDQRLELAQLDDAHRIARLVGDEDPLAQPARNDEHVRRQRHQRAQLRGVAAAPELAVAQLDGER